MKRKVKQISARGLVLIPLLLGGHLRVAGQAERMQRVDNVYSCLKEYGIEEPQTVLAIAIYETGWMECRHCSYQFNNLFGFRMNNREYLKFETIYDCIDYLKKWQVMYYDPWKLKHPNGTYYDYLAYVRYARSSMSNYVRTIKSIKRLVADETDAIDGAPLSFPYNGPEGK